MTAHQLCIALAVLCGLATQAQAARSEWTKAERSQMRILVSKPGPQGISAGLEVLLEPGWHTYWSNPGETGVPPLFDFSKSVNVASVAVHYPAPERLEDGGAVSLVYRDEVVFPLSVTPIDPAQPVDLKVDARFGVCEEICIPTQASSALTLQPGPAADTLADARLRQYVRRVPQPPTPGRFDVEHVAIDHDTLLIDVRSPDSSYSDLFASPPHGWYLGQPEFVSRAGGVSRYRLDVSVRPRGASVVGQLFRFVAVAGGEAVAQDVEIR